MIHLVISNGRVINRVNGSPPDGYPFPDHEWLPADGVNAGAQIGWIVGNDGVIAPPPPPVVEDELPEGIA